MPDHDQFFKQLLQEFFGDLLHLVAPALAEKLRTKVVRQPSIDGSWRSFTPLAALLLLDVGPATPASERLASDAKSSPDTLSIEG